MNDAAGDLLGAAAGESCVNNLRQIGIALHNYHDVHGHLPRGIYSDDGELLLSWRVELLPYLEQAPLYNEFHLDEPWHSEHNRRLIARMPAVFACPGGGDGDAGTTTYLAPIGDATMLRPDGEPVRFQDVLDGTSNTIAVVEAAEGVIWTGPDDLAFDPQNPLAGLIPGASHEGGFHVLIADGSVRLLRADTDAAHLRALFTRNGGEVAPPGP